MKKLNQVKMKTCITKFGLFIFLALGVFTLDAQQWEGSGTADGFLYRNGSVGVGVESPEQMLHTSGNLRVDGRLIYFGDTQSFEGNGNDSFIMKSNDASSSELKLRNNENVNLGLVSSTTSGNRFGLKDSNKNWVFLSRRDVFSQIRVSNIPILTARLYNLGQDVTGVDSTSTRLGVNTTQPSKDLDVRGDARVDRLYINTDSNGGYSTDEYFMFVDGKAAFEEVRVQLSQNWGDYVFEKEYEPMPLDELKEYIVANKHLPNMRKASELEKDGMEVSDMISRQMVNIEELVLYTIEQEQKIKNLESKLRSQQKEIDAIKAALLNDR